MANITTENINTLADVAASIGDEDYIYIFKASSQTFARIPKSLLVVDGGGSGGGATSGAVKRNVNALQAKVDELIGLLANSAFSTSRPAPIGTLDWGDDTPVETYYNVSGISASHAMYSVTNAATRVLAGSSYDNVITAKSGYDLLGVTVNGVAQTVDNDSCTINIANVQGDITIVVSAQAESVTPTITHTVQATLTDLNLQPYGGTVNDGGTFTATLELASGVTGKRLPTLSEITINGSHGTASLTNGVLTIPNITSDISIIAAAVATSGVTHSVTYNLSGVNKTSGATEVEDGYPLTVVLSKDSSSWDSVEGFNKRDIIVLMGGQALERGVDFTASQDSGTEQDITITVNEVTGDVTIMNVTFKNKYLDKDDAFVGTSGRNRGTVTHIPIPDGCTSLRVFHGYVSGGNFRILTYNADKTEKSAYECYNSESNPNQYRDIDLTDSGNNKFIRSPFYYFPSSYTLATCYIKDVTHNKYIWKGENVQ